eukprot:1160084-Pelagomonas_calceolata.AAC.5
MCIAAKVIGIVLWSLTEEQGPHRGLTSSRGKKSCGGSSSSRSSGSRDAVTRASFVKEAIDMTGPQIGVGL